VADPSTTKTGKEKLMGKKHVEGERYIHEIANGEI